MFENVGCWTGRKRKEGKKKGGMLEREGGRRNQMAQNALVEWNTGLCDCFEDAATCCYGFWCGPCLACSVSGKFGEFYCLPLSFSTRSSMRNRYGIKGSLCKDLVVSCCCVWCSWCQMHQLG
uniref:Uncharacterized protein n=1 Tax=Oryzias latipes TaxID=8090 RepID=A0A3B3IFR9_ORYLA